jgi:hypothetical protein
MEGFGPADLDDALCCPPSEADVPDFPDLPEPPGLIDVPPDVPVPPEVPVPFDLPEPPGPEVVDVLVPQRVEVLERDFLPPVRVVITGDPESLAEFSHLQGENSHGFDDTSGFVAVEGVLNAFGVPATEAGLVDYAVDNTLVSETGETSMDFLAQIMTEHGVPAEAGYERTLDYLATDVEQGHGVVVEVNTDLLHHDPLSPYSTELLQSQQVVVTGVMRNEASGAVEGFYVNDPVDGSAGKFVAAADMETAFNGFSIVTDDPLPLYGGEPAGPVPQAPGEPALEPTEAPADVLPLPPEVVEAPAPEVAPVLQFDPSEGTEEVVGPIEDLSLWHEQATNYTCAVVSQEFILEALTGQEFTEEQLAQEAMDQGWLSEAGGTPMDDMGKLLELHGIGVERTVDTSLEDLVSELETGNKVMVAVDSDEVWTAGQDFFADELADMLDYPGAIPGQGANHAVEVVGVDTSDPDHPMVILNDPGHPQGQGLMMPAEEFIDAWADSGHYMVATTDEPPAAPPEALMAAAAIPSRPA